MNTLAINQLSSLRWTFEEDAAAYSARGFGGIGIYRPKLEDFGIDRAVELLAETGLTATSLSWAGGFTGSDGLAFAESLDDAAEAVGQCAILNARTLVVLAGGRNNHIRNHARRTLCKALSELSPHAEEHGVRLSIEPFHPGCGDEWSFVSDLQSTLNIVESVGSPALGITLDTYHVGLDPDVLGWLPTIIPHLHLVQLGDARHSPMGEMNRCLLGQGNVPLRDILAALVEHGYGGPIEVELIGEDVEPIDYATILDHTRAYLDEALGSRTGQQADR